MEDMLRFVLLASYIAAMKQNRDSTSLLNCVNQDLAWDIKLGADYSRNYAAHRYWIISFFVQSVLASKAVCGTVAILAEH